LETFENVLQGLESELKNYLKSSGEPRLVIDRQAQAGANGSGQPEEVQVKS
jgi:hypothetical protein